MGRPSLVRTNVARLRLALSLNQQQFARLLRRSTASVQSLEMGRLRLSGQLAGEIATRTGVHPRWLMENNLSEAPYDMLSRPWSLASLQRLHNEIPCNAKADDEVFRQRMLEVASQLALARNVAGIRRLYRSVTSGGQVIAIGRRLDQFIASLMMEYKVDPDVNMTEEIRYAEREADRKTQNVLRVAGVKAVQPPNDLDYASSNLLRQMQFLPAGQAVESR
ncbi:MAG: helix-turn-helix domain-containing protein [Verrucomicrobiaceae bacterium]